MDHIVSLTSLKNKAFSLYRKLYLLYLLHPRRIHVYCVGTAKSGTTSMARMFQKKYRASHEAQAEKSIHAILAAANNSIDKDQLAKFVRTRDKQLWLEFESASFLYLYLDIIVDMFKGAKFILTIRDCYSWLDSFINHQLSQQASEHWRRFRDLRFGAGEFQFSKEEKILSDFNLYTLDGYLSYWSEHNNKVLSKVPEDRLLVIRTYEIKENIQNIAEFLKIPVNNIDSISSHKNKARKKFNILYKLDRSFLEEKVDYYCRDLMDRYFPHIKNIDDAIKKA